MKQRKSKRWHRYDSNGVKQIIQCKINEHPQPLKEEGYTQWVQGTGPHPPEVYQRVVEGVRRACLGVPKSPEQKEKMRQAKLGIPKSQEHRANMSKSHKLRCALLKEQNGIRKTTETST